MPVFRFVTIRGRFAGDHRHLSHFGVLLLDQVLACLSLDLTSEKELESGIERIPRHRVLGTEQLRRQPESRAYVAPRGARLASPSVPVIVLNFNPSATTDFGQRLVESHP